MSDDEVSNSGNHHRSMSSSRRKNRLSSAMSKDISSLPVLSADYLARYASKVRSEKPTIYNWYYSLVYVNFVLTL